MTTGPTDPTEPNDGLASFQSVKQVKAGEIAAIHLGGCYVKNTDGTQTFRAYPDGMTARYQPHTGDFWVIYEDGYQAISPRGAFQLGYRPMGNAA